MVLRKVPNGYACQAFGLGEDFNLRGLQVIRDDDLSNYENESAAALKVKEEKQ